MLPPNKSPIIFGLSVQFQTVWSKTLGRKGFKAPDHIPTKKPKHRYYGLFDETFLRKAIYP
jgi:hypothetical protein